MRRGTVRAAKVRAVTRLLFPRRVTARRVTLACSSAAGRHDYAGCACIMPAPGSAASVNGG